MKPISMWGEYSESNADQPETPKPKAAIPLLLVGVMGFVGLCYYCFFIL